MSIGNPNWGRVGERGFALFVVLWFLVLLSAIGTYILVEARSQTALARNILAGAKAEALADAGVSDAVFKLTEPVDTAQWQADGSEHDLASAEGKLAIRISDENAKMNVNLATPAQMQGLLQALGVDAGQAKSLAIAIGAWVGTVKPAGKADSWGDQYRDAGLRYEPPQAPAASVDELRFVIGMTPQIFALLRPDVTVYTARAAPDAKGASRIMQQALAFANAIQPAGSQAQTSAPAPAQAIGAGAPGGAAGDTFAPQQQGFVASVDVLAHSREGGVFARHAVVKLDPGNPKGYVVLDWQRVDADQ